jgi:hypothetical protein
MSLMMGNEINFMVSLENIIAYYTPLILTLIISILGIFYFMLYYYKNKKYHFLFASIGFIALLVLVGALLSIGVDALGLSITPVLGALLPLFISLAVFYLTFPRMWLYYFVFVILGIILIGVTKLSIPAIHSIAGLVIVAFPIYGLIKKLYPWKIIFITLGGILIGVGGLALASLSMGKPILPLETVLTLLPSILFLMSLFFFFGFYLVTKK